MNQTELVEAIREKLILKNSDEKPLTKDQITTVLHALGAVAHSELSRDGVLPLPSIGKIKAVSASARQGRNPKTGEIIEIPAAKKARFTPSQSLKDSINQ